MADDPWREAVASEPAIYQYFLRHHATEVLDYPMTHEAWEDFVNWAQDTFCDGATELFQELWSEFQLMKNRRG